MKKRRESDLKRNADGKRRKSVNDKKLRDYKERLRKRRDYNKRKRSRG